MAPFRIAALVTLVLAFAACKPKVDPVQQDASVEVDAAAGSPTDGATTAIVPVPEDSGLRAQPVTVRRQRLVQRRVAGRRIAVERRR